jgi:uncharacterized zinc-type alcohol dehydrogenase-like protein
MGSAVTRFAPGDIAAVGCLVGSCGTCASCQEHLENYCEREPVFTYNSADAHTSAVTYGGYSERIVVDEHFTLRVPAGLDPAAAAPLLCAGITTYSPLRHWNVGPGQRVGIVGLGGLGHMGVKLAHAMGAHVTLFTTSRRKLQDGKRLGADEVVVTSDPDVLTPLVRTFDFILDAVSANHDVNAYLNLLKRDGTLTLVGAPEEPMPVAPFSLLFGRRSFAGSGIGGIKETQEMLDVCRAVRLLERRGANQRRSAHRPAPRQRGPDRALRSDVHRGVVGVVVSRRHRTRGPLQAAHLPRGDRPRRAGR